MCLEAHPGRAFFLELAGAALPLRRKRWKKMPLPGIGCCFVVFGRIRLHALDDNLDLGH